MTTPHLVVLVFISPPAHKSPTVIVYLGILRLVGTSPFLCLGNRTVKYGPFQQISTDIYSLKPSCMLFKVSSNDDRIPTTSWIAAVFKNIPQKIRWVLVLIILISDFERCLL